MKDYYIKQSNGETYQIYNDRVVEQLNNKTLKLGEKITVFGTVPHYLTVNEIDEGTVVLTDDLHS